MAFFLNKPLRRLLMVMVILVITGVIIARIYYSNLNASFDPRTHKAKMLYSKYNELAEKNDYQSIFNLLDSIEVIYNGMEHYRSSYEKGVIINNKAATLLSLALNTDSLQNTMRVKAFEGIGKDSLLHLAMTEIQKGIMIYESWLQRFDGKTTPQIKGMIRIEFLTGLDSHTQKSQEKYLHRRVKEIQTAQYETQRRLSVSYTNLGTICRHLQKYMEAAKAYQKALELWDRNLAAENNLNILLNRPLKKRNFFQKLFPPDKKLK